MGFWFKGPIKNAILSAKTNGKIFLVFIEGKDDASKSMNETLSSASVEKELVENCVSIRLLVDSEEYRQFTQIYPVLVVPSSFFIGVDGIPLEVIGGSIAPEDFASKLEQTIQLHQKRIEEVGNAKEVDLSATSIPETTISLDEKVERAKQLVEERRIQKLKEERELAKKHEMEHRQMGKEVQRAKEQREERELKEWAEKRKKEKQDDILARQKVKQQIQQDREDRAARFASPPSSSGADALLSSTMENPRQRKPPASDRTRIQFRLPSGHNETQEFSANEKLDALFKYLKNEVPSIGSNFSLATTFSRRHLTSVDADKTLLELELIPSAVIMVIQNTGSAVATQGSGNFWSLFNSLISPLFFIWKLIFSFIRGERAPSLSTPPRTPSPSTSRNNNNADNQANNNPRSNPGYRRDGNVARLHSEDSDDENNTWNGNSTQQL